MNKHNAEVEGDKWVGRSKTSKRQGKGFTTGRRGLPICVLGMLVIYPTR